MLEASFHNDPSCRNLQAVVVHYIHTLKPSKLNKYGQQWINDKCLGFSKTTKYLHPYIMTNIIYSSTDLSQSEKEKLFKSKFAKQNELDFLHDSLSIRSNPKISTKNLRAKFASFTTRSFFNESIVGLTIKEYCSDKMESDYCLGFFKYIKETKDQSRIIEIKKAEF